MKTNPTYPLDYSEDEIITGMSLSFLFGIAVGFSFATFFLLVFAILLSFCFSILGFLAILV